MPSAMAPVRRFTRPCASRTIAPAVTSDDAFVRRAISACRSTRPAWKAVVSSSNVSMGSPVLYQRKVVFDDQVHDRWIRRMAAAGVVRGFGAAIGAILEDRFQKARRQLQPFPPGHRRHTVKLLADPADDEFQRQWAIAVQAAMQV